MNVQEYIKSGILEEYVLGVVSDQERREVQCLSKIYPEIETELRSLEASLTGFASLYEKKPPIELKDKIFAQMTFAEDEEAEVEDTPTQIATPELPVRPLWPSFAAAASLVLLMGTFWLFFQNRDLAETNENLAQEKALMEAASTKNASLLAFYQNPTNRVIRLQGVEKSPDSEVIVFWNQQSNEVALYVDHLPKPAPGKQYQLWTIVDGQPVDMGVLDPAYGDRILPMKGAAGKVAAFAITLEKEGGSPTPTLEAMYVVGNV